MSAEQPWKEPGRPKEVDELPSTVSKIRALKQCEYCRLEEVERTEAEEGVVDVGWEEGESLQRVGVMKKIECYEVRM